VEVVMTAFDLLFLNGKSLLKETLTERRRLLKNHFKEVSVGGGVWWWCVVWLRWLLWVLLVCGIVH
jgi:hypothetical protein